MGATRNTGYIENLIAYDGSDNIGIGGAVNVLYKVTMGGNTLISGNLNVTGTITFTSNVTANSFVKNGGVATEFLKADGTVDTSTYATVSYVDTSISNLIDAAPSALNTLNELAAALGDDSSFSTTVTTALGNRLRIDTNAQGLTTEQKANGRTNLGVVIGTDVQAYDADLGAIAALSGTSGLLKKTAANTWTLDTNTYITGGFIGTTALQSSSATQAMTGISSIEFVGHINDVAKIEVITSEANTYFDFTLADDNLQEEWRWRFNPTGGTLYSAMRLVPTTNTTSNLIVSGTIAASNFSGTSSGINTGDQDLSGYQPVDADLTAIAALAGTSGFLKKTAANTWSLDTSTYLTSYTETDTLATVTGRGASTSTAVTFSGGITVSGTAYYTFNKPSTASYQTVALFGTTGGGLFITSDNAIISKGAYYNNGWIATATAGSLIDLTANSNNPGIATFSGATVGNAVTFSTTYKIWHEGNLTNLNQLTNGPGYITSSASISGNAATASNASQLGGYSLDGATSIATRIFNNKGQVHNTYTNFNTVMSPGPNYLQQGTNGPTGTASHQWYGFMFGLGSEYGTSTGSAGHYASQLYYARLGDGGGQYLWARDMENGTWGSWRKLYAGYADTAGALSSGNKSINGNLYVTGGNPSQIILSNTNSELYVSAGAGTARMIINRESNGTQATLVFTTGTTVTQGTAWAGSGSPYTMGMTNSSQVNDFKFAVGDIYDAGSLVYRIDTSKNMYIYGSRLYNDGGTQYVYNSGTWSINVSGYSDRIQTGNNQWTWSTGAHTATNPNSITLWDQYSNYGGSGYPTGYGTIMDIYGRSGHEHDQLYFGESGQFLHRNCFYGTNTWSSWRTVITSANISSQSVSYATSAGSLNGTNYISRTGTSGNYNTDFNNTPAGSVRHHGDDPNTTNNPGGTWWFTDNYRHSNGSNYWGTQVAWGWEDNANRLAQRNVSGGNWSGWVYYLNSGNYTSYTIPRGGSWYGVNTPGSRWAGFSVSGGEIVFGDGLPTAGQMGILVDGAYVAGENNGFWSLPSNNDWNGRRGMYWDGSYLNFTTNTPTARFQAVYADGDITAFSDASVKENIRSIDNALQKVLLSKGVVYDRKDTGEKNNIGFIAQELEEQIPNLVKTDTEGFKSIKYQNMVAVLVEAIKEQQKQIEELKSQIKNK